MPDITNKPLKTHEWLNNPRLEKIWENEITLAEEGDKEARKFILTRLMPGERKGFNLPFELPPVNNIQEIDVAENKILEALNQKKITISEADELFKMFKDKKQTLISLQIVDKVDYLCDNIS